MHHTYHLIQNRIYRKIASIDVPEEINFSDYGNYMESLMALINKSYVAGGTNKVVGATGEFYYDDHTGDVFTLKSGYTVDFGQNDAGYGTSHTGWQANYIYYLNEDGQYPDGHHNPGIYAYTGSAFTLVGNTSTGQQTVPDFFDIVSLYSAVEEVPLEDAVNHIGTAATLASAAYDNTYQSDGVRSATRYDDQKFYLELNGMEV